MDFHFFMPMIPPTITQQEHKVTIRNGRPIFYEPAELKAARSELLDSVARFAPEKELTGPIRLTTKWIWPSGSEDYHWKTTKPDTDNLIKMLPLLCFSCYLPPSYVRTRRVLIWTCLPQF